jgi:hypothetical protein
MKKFILSVVVAGLAVGAAAAKPGGGNGSGPKSPSHGSPSGHWGMPSGGYKGISHSTSSSYHLSFGKSFSHGFFYSGKHHNHWSFSCWWPKYGCYTYWCPSTCCYYYWCEPASCYYPISYVAYAPPTQVQVQVTAPVTVAAPVAPAPVVPPAPVVQTQTQTQTQTQGLGAPPAGYPPLPQ